MPQEKKKRGRRQQEQQKRKHQEESSADGVSKKKREDATAASDLTPNNAITEVGTTYDPDADFIGLHSDRASWPKETSFFGFLDEEEQVYYAGANSKLELDDFTSPEDRRVFVEAVYRESEGKELKIACSQSCSRYLERLILMSNSSQLKSLWSKFKGHFLDLVQHRFASHCCETLFLKSAPIISQETRSSSRSRDGVREHPSMEQLFLDVAEELGEAIGYLLTERFASHSVRVLFVVLSGEPLESAGTRSVIASRKKEGIDVHDASSRMDGSASERREVPKSFKRSLDRLKEDATSGLKTTYLRALATHPTGNPVLQLLLRIESAAYRMTKASNDNMILQCLFSDASFEDGSDNSKFVLGLLYDPAGSRLLETVVQTCPGKFFKSLYSSILKAKITSIAKNDVACYVALRVFERIGKDDLQDAINLLLPDLSSLIARHRLDIIRVLVERSIVRNLDPRPIGKSIMSAYGDDYGSLLLKILRLDAENAADSPSLVGGDSNVTPAKVTATSADPHGAILAQTMLRSPGLAAIVQEAILATPQSLLVNLANDPAASRVIQEALTTKESPSAFRRQLIPRFYGTVGILSIEGSGSRVVDCLWPATSDLHYMKERLAQEISMDEAILRESLLGRAVWRNWKMDLYRRRKMQWNAEAKGITEENDTTTALAKKSGIELARSRFAAKQARQAWLKQEREIATSER